MSEPRLRKDFFFCCAARPSAIKRSNISTRVRFVIRRKDVFFCCAARPSAISASGGGEGTRKREAKDCRVCQRSCTERDPVAMHDNLAWGYAQDAWYDEDGLENVAGRTCWWCSKNNEMNYNRTPAPVLQKNYMAGGEWKDEFELNRDAIIAMAMAMGKDNLKKTQMPKYKETKKKDETTTTTTSNKKRTKSTRTRSRKPSVRGKARSTRSLCSTRWSRKSPNCARGPRSSTAGLQGQDPHGLPDGAAGEGLR